MAGAGGARHIPSEAEFWVGGHLGIAVSHVREVVSFYRCSHGTSRPAGASRLHSLPCLLRGADEVLLRSKNNWALALVKDSGGELM